MSNMNERIKQIRTELDLSTREFASKLGMSNGAISLLETGKRNPTSQFITSMCREFNVNEDWLRTGEGEMFIKLTREEEIAKLVVSLAQSDDEISIKMAALLPKLTTEQIRAVYNMAVLLEKENLPD